MTSAAAGRVAPRSRITGRMPLPRSRPGAHPVWIAAAKVLTVLALPLGGPSWHAATFLLLAAWALREPRAGIEALTLSWLALYLNPGLYALSEHATTLRWLVVTAAFTSATTAAVRTGAGVPKAWIWVVAFVVVAGVLSACTSYAPTISLLKLLSFFVATTTVLFSFHLARRDDDYWDVWFPTFFVVVLLVSFPLIVRDAGYVVNQRGFQGILNQPQAYGIFIAPFLAWLASSLALGQKRGAIYSVSIVLAVVSLWATQSRTAGIAVVAGLIVALSARLPRRPRPALPSLQSMARQFLLASLVLVTGILNATDLERRLRSFVLKGEISSSITESLDASRGAVVERSWANFVERPVLGNGFGVGSDQASFEVSRDALFRLPVEAPIEKSLVITAVLEEVGLVGSFFWLALVASVVRPILARGAPVPVATLAFSALAVNLGENVFFSVGGMGLLVWLLLGAAQRLALVCKVPCRGLPSGRTSHRSTRRL